MDYMLCYHEEGEDIEREFATLEEAIAAAPDCICPGLNDIQSWEIVLPDGTVVASSYGD